MAPGHSSSLPLPIWLCTSLSASIAPARLPNLCLLELMSISSKILYILSFLETSLQLPVPPQSRLSSHTSLPSSGCFLSHKLHTTGCGGETVGILLSVAVTAKLPLVAVLKERAQTFLVRLHRQTTLRGFKLNPSVRRPPTSFLSYLLPHLVNFR